MIYDEKDQMYKNCALYNHTFGSLPDDAPQGYHYWIFPYSERRLKISMLLISFKFCRQLLNFYARERGKYETFITLRNGSDFTSYT